jgi:hypothetical protein
MTPVTMISNAKCGLFDLGSVSDAPPTHVRDIE